MRAHRLETCAEPVHFDLIRISWIEQRVQGRCALLVEADPTFHDLCAGGRGRGAVLGGR
jgi:hypothetical protein